MDPQDSSYGSAADARIEKQRHFIRAMSKSIEGRPLERSERFLLEKMFTALMRGEDVSDLTGVRRSHTQRSTDPIYAALHYLCLTRLMDARPEAAWDAVGQAWGLSRREVRRLIVLNREPALAALPRFAGAPVRLLSICERRARGARPARDRSTIAPSPPISGDALIPMLTRLLQRTAVRESAAP